MLCARVTCARKGPDGRDQIALYAFRLFLVKSKLMLATNMPRMCNNNLKIRFAGSSGRLQHAISELAQAFQSESKCETIDMKTIFYFHENKVHFHKNGFLHVASF